MANALNKVNSGGIEDGSIVNADIKSDAAIATTKIDNSGDVHGWNTTAGLNVKDESSVSFYEASGNGTNKVSLKAPAALGADYTITLPPDDGDNLQFLQTNGSGVTDWATVSSTPEGTAVLSTGESGGTKFLREDGDGTSSWQTVPAGGVAGISSSADATAITIDSSENVGIQTTAPQYKFEVDTTATEKTSVGFSANGESADIRFRSNNVNEAAVIRVDESGGGGLLRFHNKNGSGTLTQNLEIETDGDVKVNTGNLIIGTSGKGIDFSATSDGSGTDSSELLDDYEEGTFTPYFHLGSSPGAVTTGSKYQQQDGRYTKIGRFVSATFAVQGHHPNSEFDNWSSGDGFIKGWPYPFMGSQPQQVAFCRIHGTAGSWGTTYAPYVIYENYSDKAHLQGYNSGGVEPPGNAGNSFGYWGSLQYHTT